MCACPQEPTPYYGAICENSVPVVLPPKVCIYSKDETLFFSGTQLGRLRFVDIVSNVYAAYNSENIMARNVCPPTFTLVGNACYRVLTDTLYDWNQAKSQCLLLNSDLAWFTSTQDLDLVRSWLNGQLLVNDIWTGGRQQYNSWYWDFNNTAIPSNVLNANWAPGRPTASSTLNAILLSRTNGYLFVNEAPERRSYSILCKKNAFVFDSSDTILSLTNQITAIDLNGNPLLGFRFVTNVTESGDSISRVVTPSSNTYMTIFSQIPLLYGQYFSGTAYPYTSPFVLSVCGDLTLAQIEQVRRNIRSTWLSVRPEFVQCNCFDVFIVGSEKYTGINNQINTQLTYVPRANQLIIETTSSGPIPSVTQIYSSLGQLGITQCAARNKRSSLLSVNVEGPALDQVSALTLEKTVQRSLYVVRPDLETNNKNVAVKIISNSDAIDLNSKSAITQVYLQVTVDGQLLDYYTQTEFDTQTLIDQINYQNEKNSLNIITSNQIYSRNYFLTLISNVKVKKIHYEQLEKNVLNVFLDNYPQFKSEKVDVITTWQEEYLDESKNVVWGLNLLIKVDKQPVDNILILDRNIFANLKSLQISQDLVYNVKLPKADSHMYPLSKSLTFFSNNRIVRRDYAKIEALVQKTIEEYNSGLYINNLNKAFFIFRNL